MQGCKGARVQRWDRVRVRAFASTLLIACMIRDPSERQMLVSRRPGELKSRQMVDSFIRQHIMSESVGRSVFSAFALSALFPSPTHHSNALWRFSCKKIHIFLDEFYFVKELILD